MARILQLILTESLRNKSASLVEGGDPEFEYVE
jgi:hypothetical protein